MIAWEYGMFDLRHGLSNRFDFQPLLARLLGNPELFAIYSRPYMTRLILWCNAIV